jgi:hypothetical protein
VFLRLHTPAFDRAISVALLKELMRLVAGRVGGDEGGEAKGGDKVNLVIEGGDKVILMWLCTKKYLFQLINIKVFFLFSFFLTKKMDLTFAT